jgi:hypothetical protein
MRLSAKAKRKINSTMDELMSQIENNLLHHSVSAFHVRGGKPLEHMAAAYAHADSADLDSVSTIEDEFHSKFEEIFIDSVQDNINDFAEVLNGIEQDEWLLEEYDESEIEEAIRCGIDLLKEHDAEIPSDIVREYYQAGDVGDAQPS